MWEIKELSENNQVANNNYNSFMWFKVQVRNIFKIYKLNILLNLKYIYIY